MLKIAIDTGHGLNTAGKEVPAYMGLGKIKEWTLNDKITRTLIDLLEGYDVETLRLDDPTGNKDIPVKDRTKKANEWGADILISNHHNAGINGGNGGGLVVIRKAGNKDFTREMQKLLYDCILEKTELKGNRYDPLAEYKNLILLNTAKMPAVLIEHGFMDSPSDMKAIMQDDFAEKSAEGIVKFLEKQYGIIEGGKEVANLNYLDQTSTLYKGIKNNYVKQLQQDLIKLGYNLSPYGADGSFGSLTETVVKQWQEANGLEVDGRFGPASRKKMKELLKALEPVAGDSRIRELQSQVTQLEARISKITGLLKEALKI